jgi:hypothetical protein
MLSRLRQHQPQLQPNQPLLRGGKSGKAAATGADVFFRAVAVKWWESGLCKESETWRS